MQSGLVISFGADDFPATFEDQEASTPLNWCRGTFHKLETSVLEICRTNAALAQRQIKYLRDLHKDWLKKQRQWCRRSAPHVRIIEPA